MGSSRDIQPRCPRCGYDQRGVMQSWVAHGACPLEGVCSECGLTFEWGDIFDPVRGEPVEYVEYAPSQPRAWLWSCARTFGRTWLPWKFWRRLQLHHSVRPWRIVAYLLLMAFLFFGGLYVTTQTATAVYDRGKFSKDHQYGRRQLVARLEVHLSNWNYFVRVNGAPRYYLEQATLMAAIRDGDPGTIGQAEVAARAAAMDQATWDVLRQGMIEELRPMIEGWKVELDDPQPIGIGYGHAILQSVFMPWKSDSGVTIMFSGVPPPYPSSDELYRSLPGLADYFATVRLGRLSSELRAAIIGPVYWLLVSCAYPLFFALLPVTRRRAKVRWSHVTRIWLYGLAIPIGLTVSLSVMYSITLFIDNGISWWRNWATTPTLYGPAPFVVAWWYCAIRFHLRLPNALLVAMLLGLLAVLAVIAVGEWTEQAVSYFITTGRF